MDSGKGTAKKISTQKSPVRLFGLIVILHEHGIAPAITAPFHQSGRCLLVHFINVTACSEFATTSSGLQTLHGYEINISTANSRLSTIRRYKKRLARNMKIAANGRAVKPGRRWWL